MLSIGEIFWRLAGASGGGSVERLDGAPFWLAVELARLGHTSFLLSAVGNDERGRAALREAAALGIDVRFIGTCHQAETGILCGEDFEPAGPPDQHGGRPFAYDFLEPGDELMAGPFDAICYGTHLHAFEPARRAAERVLQTFPSALRFFDAQAGATKPQDCKLEDLMRLANVVHLPEQQIDELTEGDRPFFEDFCATQANLFNLKAFLVTRKDGSCAVRAGESYAEAKLGSANNAQISARFLHGVGAGWTAQSIAEFLQ